MDFFSYHAHSILLAAALLSILLLFFLRITSSRRQTARRIRLDLLSVLPAIERYLEGEEHLLSIWLRRVARRYPEEVRTFILIGTLLRRGGSPFKASVLHRTLLYRKHLSGTEKALILLELGRDYRALGNSEKALVALKQSVITEKNISALQELVEIEVAKDLFDDALFHQREMNVMKGKRDEGLRNIMLVAAERSLAKKNLDEARRWGEMAARHEGDTPLGCLFAVFNTLCVGDTVRSLDLATGYLERFPAEEITLRYLLLHFPGHADMSHFLPGQWAPVFAALVKKDKIPSPHEIGLLDKNSILYYYLWARNAPSEEARALAAAVGRYDQLFACAACRRPLSGLVLVCAGCGLPLTVKWKTI